MKSIGYYPGCSLHATGREYGESAVATLHALAVELREIEDWSCCGATSAHATDHLLSVALPARNLALAEAQGIDEVLAPCAACFNRLATARHELTMDQALATRVSGLLDRPFANRVRVRNVVDVLHEVIPTVKAKVTRPLAGVRVACYYGCLLLRPAEVTGFDDAEVPTTMEDIVRATGAKPVEWGMRLECCGAGMSLARVGSVVRLGRAIIDDARRAGADAIAVACPMCHSNLDFRQSAMALRGEQAMPIVYLTELVGLALGLSPEELGLGRHFVGTSSLVARATAPPPPPQAATPPQASKGVA
jgi:heterodisulfide reductase subunit B2